MKKNLLTVILLVIGLSAAAQTPIIRSDTSKPSHITPYYFGPNAFPVPDLLDNLEGAIRGDLLADGFEGSLCSDRDYAVALSYRITFPLWSDRINFSSWGQIREWYWDNPAVRAARGVAEAEPLHGNALGDAYMGTEMLLLREGTSMPGLTARVALKTASGDSFEKARYYDCPGYFFDAYLFKTIPVSEDGFLRSVRLTAGGGFLCWQTDNGRQNDALLLIAGATAVTSLADIAIQVGGYRGWERCHDFPVSAKMKMEFTRWEHVNPIIRMQYGINDYPFFQIGGGITVRL